MKTVLQINSVANSGSTGRIVEEISQLAISSGWQSYIAYGRWQYNSKTKLIKIGNIISIYLHGLISVLFDGHGYGSKRATKKFLKKVDLLNPDIIHLHNIHGYYINIKLLFNYLEKKNIPVIWTLHDCWAFTGHCAHFDFIGCNKWMFQCHLCPQKHKYPASLFLSRSSHNYLLKKKIFNQIKKMTIVPVSYWLSLNVQKSFLNRHPVHIIQNGIDLDVFSAQYNVEQIKIKYGINGKFLILGVASPWTKLKGLNDFILLHKLLDQDCIILLVGLNKKQIQKLPSGIIGIERTENIHTLANLYSAADLYINPTWEETFSLTNLESMACGTPIITYRTGGSVELVSENTGFIVNKGDINELYKYVNIVKQAGKAFYSEYCRKHAISQFNKQTKFLEYINLYNQIS